MRDRWRGCAHEIDHGEEDWCSIEVRRSEIADGTGGEDYALTRLQRLFLFTRSDTIYGGSNQIQRNIIAERALGLPREPR